MKSLLLAAFFVAASASLSFAAPIINGDFEQGLTGWTTTGSVTVETDPNNGNMFARVVDNVNPPGFSTLEQTFNYNQTGILQVRFDVLGGLLSPSGRARVTFYDVFNNVVADYDQVNNTTGAINLTASSPVYNLGSATETYRVVVFVDPGTVTYIDVDNFTATVVPEPATVTVLLIGVGALARKRFKS